MPHENRVGALTCAVLLRSSRWGWESRGVLLTLVYVITRLVLAVVTVLVRREVSKDVELCVASGAVSRTPRTSGRSGRRPQAPCGPAAGLFPAVTRSMNAGKFTHNSPLTWSLWGVETGSGDLDLRLGGQGMVG